MRVKYIDFYQQQLIIEMKKIEKPFVHYVVDNFLSPQNYKKLVNAYDHLQFIEKESDLFHFYQTNQLADEPSLAFFKEELNRQFSQIQPLKNTFYNIFASYYFKGDYLLCHDDVIDDRKYAFSYYLEDHASADLVLYDETATKPEKRIKVKKNTLAIFQVSNISYHEVALSKSDGRKAVTGWLNLKGQGAKREVKQPQPYQPFIPSDLAKFQFQEDISKEQYIRIPNTQYLFDVESRSLAGPFYAKKATKLVLSQYVVLELKGATLFSADFYQFNKGDYMLLNDPVNSLGDNIIDIFITQLPKKKSPAQIPFIKIVDEEGVVTGGIPYENNCMYIVQRGKKNYYIDLVEEQIYVGHLIYKKNVKKSKKNETVSESKNIKELRQKLVNHHKEMNAENQEQESEIIEPRQTKKKQIKKQQKATKRAKKSK